MRQPAKTIQRKQFVFINGGTTNLAAARIIHERLSTTVAIQYPAIAAALATRQDITLIMIVGRLGLIEVPPLVLKRHGNCGKAR